MCGDARPRLLLPSCTPPSPQQGQRGETPARHYHPLQSDRQQYIETFFRSRTEGFSASATTTTTANGDRDSGDGSDDDDNDDNDGGDDNDDNDDEDGDIIRDIDDIRNGLFVTGAIHIALGRSDLAFLKVSLFDLMLHTDKS